MDSRPRDHRHHGPEFGQNLLAAFEELFRTSQLCDVSICVKKGDANWASFQTHKLILSAVAPFFKERFLKEQDLKTVQMEDVEPGAMQAFLSYAYTGRVDMPEASEEVSRLRELFLRLQMPESEYLFDPDGCKVCFKKQRLRRRVKKEIAPPELQATDPIIQVENDENLLTSVKTEEEDYDEEYLNLTPELILREEEEAMAAIGFDPNTLIIREAPPSPKKRGRPRKNEPLSDAAKHGNCKKHLCSLCGKWLTGLTAYNRHQVIHTGARPFECSVCGKSFTQEQRLTVHMRIHTGERPYLCCLCGKTFTESCKLKRHMSRVHKANKDGAALFPGQPVINAVKEGDKQAKTVI